MTGLSILLRNLFVLGTAFGLACQTAPPPSSPPTSSLPTSASPGPTPPPAVPSRSAAPPRVSRPAPTFVVETFNSGKFNLSEHRGKVVVVNFWATWCPPCVAEMPGFDATYRRLKDDGLEIVGLSLDQDGPAVVKNFLAKRRISYPIAMGDPATAIQFGIGNGIPYTVFIDRQGNIRDTVTGGLSEAVFEQKVKALLAEPA